jgi:hypothetical protein
MHEEEAAPTKKNHAKSEYKEYNKSKWYRKSNDDQKSEHKKTDGPKGEDKLEALKSFRRSKGLFYLWSEMQ